jgi:hypothetical protein
MPMLIIALASCEKSPTEVDDYEREPILSGFLFNGERADHVFLDRVATIAGYYHPDDWFIYDADIRLLPVDNPALGDTAHFRHHYSIELGWLYIPELNEYIFPRAGARYRIEVQKNSENISMWAETIIPDTLSVCVTNYEAIGDTLWMPLDWNDEPVHVIWSESEYAGGYVLRVIYKNEDPLTRRPYPQIPLDPNLEDQPDTLYLDVFRSDVHSTDIPWLAFNYEGYHLVQIQAASMDYIEYLESLLNAQESNPITNVHGGRGVFSGLSSDGFYLSMQRVR